MIPELRWRLDHEAAGTHKKMTELVRRRIELDPLKFSSGNKHRTPGLHLTDVIKDILFVLGVSKDNSTFTAEQLPPFQLQGYMWEDVFTGVLRDRVAEGAWDPNAQYVMPGELAVRLDGSEVLQLPEDSSLIDTTGYLIMTPDLCRMDILRGVECKWTTKSALMRPEKDRPDWLMQAKGVLYGLSLWLHQQIETFEWNVMFPCGEYWVVWDDQLVKGKIQPRGTGVIYEQWTKEISWRESQDFWEMLVQHVYDRVNSEPEHPWKKWVI